MALLHQRVVLTALAAVFLAATGQAAPPSADLLPATTRQHVSIPDLAAFQKGFDASDPGKLFASEDFKAVVDQAKTRGLDGLDLGITFDEMKAAAGGEVAWAIVQSTPTTAGQVFLLNATGKVDTARALLKEISARLQKKGRRPDTQQHGGAEALIFTTAEGSHACTLKDDLLICTNGLPVLLDLLQRWSKAGKDSLGQVEAFRKTRDLCREKCKAPGAAFLFLEPFGLAKAQRVLQKEPPPRRDMLKILEEDGFNAIQGVGGVMAFGAGPHELCYHLAIHAPRPHHGSMRMLRFVEGKDFTTPAWVPANVSVNSTVWIDVKNAFETVGSLFDAVYGDGEKGTFDAVIRDLKEDKNGPQLDFPKEVIARLGQRITVISDSETSGTETSERLVVAIEAREEKQLERAIRLMMENDEEVKRTEFRGHVLWAMPAPKKKKPKPGEKAPPPGTPTILTVGPGLFYLSNNVKLLEKVLTTKGQSLGQKDDFKRVSKELDQLGRKNVAVRWFARPDQDFQLVYEALRRNEVSTSRSIYAQILNQLVGEPGDAIIDVKKLPPFERVKPYLGPAGLSLTIVEDGWLLSGFALKK